MSEWTRVFTRGVTLENPLMRLMIGLCATLAVSSQVQGSFFMGLAVIFVLVMSNAIISAIRGFIPSSVRIPIFIVVIASFVTIVDLTMHAFLLPIYNLLGVWIPLIVVNCIILGRAEAFAYHNKLSLSIADGLGQGLGYTLVIVTIGVIRELFGTGRIQFLGSTVVAMPAGYQGPGILIAFPGAFILFGFLMAGFNWLESYFTARGARRAASVGGVAEEVA